ncbi:MAG: RIP metalloprotease RseP [Hahellaceae bacterium]|nr:RIP metalloprotease RseP [Hahellaceae bacterium]
MGQTLLQNTLALIVTLGLLVTIHEFGHFWVARRCGVKVLRFSVGFGRPILKWLDRHGTEYVVAALPLGGYVKMLDEREAPVAPELLDQAFNRKPVAQRIAIASAGPLANFLFALMAYWIMFVAGVQVVVPKIGGLSVGGAAETAGLQVGDIIVDVDGRLVHGWNDVNFGLVDRIGDTGELAFQVQREAEVGAPESVRVPITTWLSGEKHPDPLKALGIEPWRPAIVPVIHEVVADSRAAQAGLQAGDELLTIDGQALDTWMVFVDKVRLSPELPLSVEYRRGEQSLSTTLVPGSRETSQGTEGFVGVSVEAPAWPEDMKRTVSYGLLEAVMPAVKRTAEMSAMILGSLKKLVLGTISVENLGGPITIAKAAGASASFGVESFLTFLAQLSVMLGVLNLLPIPVLDGGHLLYYGIEAVRGKPLSEKKQILGIKIGMALLAGVMALALFNDFSRL